MKSNLSYYFSIFLRRIHYFLIVFLTVAAVSITLAKILPPSYVSEARLLVEPPQIPGQLQAPTVQIGAAEELQIIEQQLMTRTNLLAIAREKKVFDDLGAMTADDIVRKMRKATGIRRIAGRGQATLMYISFTSKNPKTSADVTNEYVTLILQNNAKTRAERATNTLEFFQTEVERLGKKLQEQSAAITEFKNANIDALPDTLQYRLNQQTVLQDRLSSVERQISSLEEQRRSLVDIYNKTGQVGNANTANMTPEQRTLLNLQDQLRQALALYSPENPKVKIIQAQITQQEKIVAGQVAAGTSNPQSPTTLLDINLASIDAQIKLLKDQQAQISQQLSDLKDTLDRTPANSIKLGGLNRDYQNTQQQYNAAVNSLQQASMGERIEVLSKGQRIAILDPATVPNRPASPNRLLIGAGGTVFGFLLGLGLVFLMEFLNKSIRRPVDITRGLGITPIATIPYVRTPMELVVRRAGFVAIMAVVIVGIPAVLYAIHTFYMPLDLIYDRVAQKINGLL